jgi:FtsZ-binding cell division protein ZapB
MTDRTELQLEIQAVKRDLDQLQAEVENMKGRIDRQIRRENNE